MEVRLFLQLLDVRTDSRFVVRFEVALVSDDPQAHLVEYVGKKRFEALLVIVLLHIQV